MWSIMANVQREMAMERGTPAQYVAILSGLVEYHGCSVTSLLKGTRIKPADLENINVYIPQSDFTTIIENAYRLTGLSALGIEFGSRVNMSSHVTLGYALMNCPTFGEAMDFFLKYYRLVIPSTVVNAGKTTDRRHATIKLKENSIRPAYFSLECYFSAVYAGARFLLQTRDIPFELELEYPAPEHEKEYYRFFGRAVKFDCLQNSLSFPNSIAKTNLMAANASLLAIYEQQCKVLLASIEREDTITEKVYQLLSQFDGGYPTLEKTAQLLAFSPRTLRRRLESEGSNYQRILDEVRRDQAIELLTHSTLPLSSISFTLGFNDVSNFRRAFIKWTGKSPLDFRH
jgi:AraC-like DNA-binding protein